MYYNVKLRRILATIVAVENQWVLHIVSAKKLILIEILRDSVTKSDEMRPEQNTGCK
jgi:hypothetical protein